MAGGSDFNYWLFEITLLIMALEIMFQLEYASQKIIAIVVEYSNPKVIDLSG